MKEIDELMEVSPQIIALDACCIKRPDGATLDERFSRATTKDPDQMLMADCSALEEALHTDGTGFD